MATIGTIFEKLHQLSQEGKVAWKPTVDPSTFSVVLGESSGHISKAGDETYHFKVLNSSGDDIDQMSYVGEGSFSGPPIEFLHSDPRIEELYEMARRRALNIDAELDKVLVELNQL